jgi:xanthine dehydrogenase small subunit
MRDYLLLYINGKEHRVTGAQAFMPLSSYLRGERGYTGTKVVCEEGDCGACSVLLGRVESGEMRYKAVNSCIQFVYQLDCAHIVTIEGLKQNGELNPVQEAMVQCHGAQCGFCTPGFVVTMCSMFDRKPPENAQDVKDGLTGNLCRCTGYEAIINAALAVDAGKVAKIAELYPSAEMLEAFARESAEPAEVRSPDHILLVPNNLREALRMKKEHPNAVIVSGGTDVCVYWNKRGTEPRALLSLANVTELRPIVDNRKNIQVGARATLSELEEFVQQRYPELARIMWLFGSPQIRNAGTLAGNIANGSPIADSIPFLYVMDAEIEVSSERGGYRIININEFYKGYKQLAIESDELITNIYIPAAAANEVLKLYKVSKRRHLDISAFTAAIRLSMNGDTVEKASIAYGGVAATVMRLPKTEAFLAGKKLTFDVCEEAGQIARSEIKPISDVRGSADFRLTLAENIFRKLYFDLAAEPRTAACPL